jgi:hypothetical protein
MEGDSVKTSPVGQGGRRNASATVNHSMSPSYRDQGFRRDGLTGAKVSVSAQRSTSAVASAV